MKTVTGDLWQYAGRAWIVVPTNLVASVDSGRASMHTGVAAQARDRYPELDRLYNNFLLMCRDHLPQLCVLFASDQPLFGGLILFPTRELYRDKARLDYIEVGLRHLVALPIMGPVALPCLGMGYGRRTATEILPLLDKYLTADRFTLVKRGPEVQTRYADSFRSNLKSFTQQKYTGIALHDRSLTEENTQSPNTSGTGAGGGDR